MEGKRGNDTYRVQSTGDQVVELPGEGFDLVELWVRMNYVLPVNIEDATALLGGNLTGNAAANSITVSADDLGGYRQYTDDILDGREGADRMAGGFGNDTYFVDNVLDRVFEGEVAGIDTVRSVVSFTLGDNVENLILTGVAGIGGTGNALANTMTGNAAGNALDGGMGVDRLVGGLGADTYFVDQLSDVVVETGTDIDTVFASSSYTLSALVENLYFMGAQGTVGVGNALNNKMYGNAGDNQLIGGAGVDEMRGGLGNDMYNVDNAGDIVVEAAGQGTDTVVSSIAYTLGATLENLTLTGAAAINGTGNTLANQLLGNAGANVLNGGLGADYMYGGAGNDTFVVDNAADLAVESNAHGTDTVNASVTFTLMTHVENLNLTGAAAINGTGNGLANTILGNAAGNIIDGLQGADIMTGGLGADTFVFSQLGAVDTITDFNAPFDTIRVSNAAFGGVLTVGAFVTFVSGATPAPAQARPTFLYDTDDGRVLYDRDGSGVVFAPVHFATLTGAPAIGVGDFAVVA